MTTQELLERRHEAKLGWVEPWPGCDPDGSETRSSMGLMLADESQPQAVRDFIKESGLDKDRGHTHCKPKLEIVLA